MDYKEIIRRNGLNAMLWVVHKELKRGIIVRNRLTCELRVLDTK
jgi:hypothetical protein